MSRTREEDAIVVRSLECRYGETTVLRDLNFTVRAGEVFVVAGPSGCGKSTLLKNMIGLEDPARGEVLYFGQSFSQRTRKRLLREIGILYQSGALWSAMTIEENVALPLQQFTRLSLKEIRRLVALKLALVGLRGAEQKFPAELSGGMRKRAGLARALALDPKFLFFDEPSAGLDPITSRNLDRLILRLRNSLGTTVVVVSHELDSIFEIADRILVLDPEEHTAIAEGAPRDLLAKGGDRRVNDFLTRGGDPQRAAALAPGERNRKEHT